MRRRCGDSQFGVIYYGDGVIFSPAIPCPCDIVGIASLGIAAVFGSENGEDQFAVGNEGIGILAVDQPFDRDGIGGRDRAAAGDLDVLDGDGEGGLLDGEYLRCCSFTNRQRSNVFSGIDGRDSVLAITRMHKEIVGYIQTGEIIEFFDSLKCGVEGSSVICCFFRLCDRYARRFVASVLMGIQFIILGRIPKFRISRPGCSGYQHRDGTYHGGCERR